LGHIQGTFKEHSENIQGTGHIQGTFGAHLGNIQGTGNIQGALKEQGTFSEQLGHIQGTFSEYSVNIQVERPLQFAGSAANDAPISLAPLVVNFITPDSSVRKYLQYFEEVPDSYDVKAACIVRSNATAFDLMVICLPSRFDWPSEEVCGLYIPFTSPSYFFVPRSKSCREVADFGVYSTGRVDRIFSVPDILLVV
jgi:hypothetical protein